MKTTLIFVRHGFSVSNDQKYFTGNLDIPLTELGRLQAEKCAEYLKEFSVDYIYASDLSRAMDTAKPISEAFHMPVHPDPALREIQAGEWEGVKFTDLDLRYPQSYRIWRTDIGNAVCDGGESVQLFSERILKSTGEIAKRHTGKTVVIVTHATPIRVISTVADGLPIHRMAEIPWVSNASISIFEYEDGEYTLVKKDITEHLGDMKTALPKNV